MNRNVDSKGLLALIAGGAAIAFAPIGVRLADVSPTASAFWRLALASVVLRTLSALAQRGPRAAAYLSSSRPIAGELAPPVRRAPWRWVLGGLPRSIPTPLARSIVLAGFFFAGDLGVWHLSIAYTSVANATLEANFAPIFVALAGWLWFDQRVTHRFVVAMAMTLAGAALLIGPHFAVSGRALLGDGLGTLTAVFYAGYMLAVKAASRYLSALQIASAATTIAAVTVLPYAVLTAERFWPHSLGGWGVIATLAVVVHSGGQTLIAYGLGRVPAALGSLTLLIQPIGAALYAYVLLDEPVAAMQIAGGTVVLAGIWLAQRSGLRAEPLTDQPVRKARAPER